MADDLRDGKGTKDSHQDEKNSIIGEKKKESGSLDSGDIVTAGLLILGAWFASKAIKKLTSDRQKPSARAFAQELINSGVNFQTAMELNTLSYETLTDEELREITNAVADATREKLKKDPGWRETIIEEAKKLARNVGGSLVTAAVLKGIKIALGISFF